MFKHYKIPMFWEAPTVFDGTTRNTWKMKQIMKYLEFIDIVE